MAEMFFLVSLSHVGLSHQQFPTMLQDLIIKILSIHNVKKKKKLSLEPSASAAHTWTNTRFNISEFPFIPKQN